MTSAIEAPLRIGLVNMMPQAARRATERQFHSLAREAAGRPSVLLSFHLEDASSAQIDRAPATPSSLQAADLDALIVTGAEPQRQDLRQEDFWTAMAAVVEWAAEHPIASYWSCLAAHAAVLHLDGVERRPLAAKLSGVFETWETGAARISRRVPHSRFNGVDEHDLVARGYLVHSRSATVGVDAFVRPGPGSFLLHQGHPEYAPETLGFEWRRDLRRFLAGERPAAPDPPMNTYGPELDASLRALWRRDDRDAAAACLDLATRATPASHTWRSDSVRLFRSWLDAERTAADRRVSAA